MPRTLTVITGNQRNDCIKQFRLLTLFTIIILWGRIDNMPASAQSSPGKNFTVTIDAGHGGKDTGAPGKKSVEKNIALGIALKLGHYIESLMEDVDVYYIRKTDVFIPLYERAQIANRNKSDLFISVHVNANKKSALTGTSTYVMGFSKSQENLDLVMQENKAILLENDYQTKYAGFDPTSPESYIIFNNVQNNNLTQSLEIAAAVQDQLRTQGQRKDDGVHQGNFVVLWSCAKPSILVETGFISNPREEEFLMTDNGQNVIALGIYTAFHGYKELVDERVNVIAKTTIPGTETEKKVIENEKRPVDTVTKTADTEKRTVEIDKKPADTVKRLVEIEKKPVDNVSGTLSESEVEYRVQILASVKKLPTNAKDFKGIKDIEEIQIDGYYKYMSRSVNSYPAALELRRKLGATFRGAFIVGFKKGKKVPLNTLIDNKKKL